MVALGDPVHGASCVGVGKGSNKWSEEELKALEIGVVGGFARGCHDGGIAQFALLSAGGSTALRFSDGVALKDPHVSFGIDLDRRDTAAALGQINRVIVGVTHRFPADRAEEDLRVLRTWVNGQRLPANVTGEVYNADQRRGVSAVQVISTLGKKMGLTVTSTKDEDGGRNYSTKR